MKQPSKITYANRLAFFRKKNSIGQKTVATLLGRRSVAQVSRLELGVKLPSLKTALKLAIIYKIPVHILLNGYLEACGDEMKRHQKKVNLSESNLKAIPSEIEYCSFDERLGTGSVRRSDLDKARGHAAAVARRCAEAMGHF